MTLKEIMKEVKMSQREFQYCVGYDRNKIAKHDLVGGILNEYQLDEIRLKSIMYAKSEIVRYTKLIERLGE